MTDEKIQQIIESNGVMFVNRSYGLCSTKTITLNALIKIIHDCEVELQTEPARGAKL